MKESIRNGEKGSVVQPSDTFSLPYMELPDDIITNFFKSVIQREFLAPPNETNLFTILNEVIFDGKSPNEIKQKYRSLNISFDVICGKTIPKKTTYYFCLDCDRVSREEKTLVGAICQQCFLSSNHEGHRVIQRKNKYNVSQCYCGDSSIFESSAFCEQHSKKSLTYEEIQEKLGEEFINKFNESLKLAFYGICILAEIHEKVKDTPKKMVLRDTFGVLLDQILEFCNFCSNELTPVFLVIIGKMLTSNFLPKYSDLWHTCNDLKGRKGFVDHVQPCSCVILDVLLRHISLLDSSKEAPILFRNLLKDNEFRQIMAVAFVKYLQFIFLNDNPKRRLLNLSYSKFAKMSQELYLGSDLCEAAIKSGYTIQIFEILEDVLLKYTCLQGSFQNLVYELKVLLEFMMRPHTNSCKLLLKNNYILIVMMELLAGFGESHIYPSPIALKMSKSDMNYSFLNDSFQCEGLVTGIFRRAILQLDELDEREREIGLHKLCLYWKETYNQKLRKDKKRDPRKYCFHPVLERLLQHIIRENHLEISKEYISSFIQKKIQVKEHIVAENIVQGLLKPIGALKLLAFVDPNSYDQAAMTYYSPIYNLFDNDILTLQMFLPFIPKESIYELLVKSYFSYSKEIIDFLLEARPLPKDNIEILLNLIQEFFLFLLYVMNDEICLVNNLLTREPSLYINRHEANTKIKKVTKKVVINILSCYTWIELPELINNIKSVIDIKNIDDLLSEVAILDERTRRLRIKEDHFQDYDAYMFYGRSHLQRELETQFLEKMKGSTNIDFISGFYYTGLPDHLYEVQQAIMKGPLFEFITKLFNVEKEEYIFLRRIGLKLLLFALNSTEYMISSGLDASALLKHINKNFQSNATINKLNSITENEAFSDCHIIVENIIESLERLKDFETDNNNSFLRSSVVMPSDDKKEFSYKESIEVYIQRNTVFKQHHHDQEHEQDEDNEFRITCNHCLQIINTKESEYLVPAFLSVSNVVSAGKSTSIPEELEKGVKYPYVSSCLHFFHEECLFEADGSLHENAVFKERSCPICHSIYNYFMIMNHPLERHEDEEGEHHMMMPLLSEKKYALILSALSYMTENEDWYREYALSEESMVPEYIPKGLNALSNSLMFFLETLDFDASYENFVKDVEVLSCLLKSVKTQLQTVEKEGLWSDKDKNSSQNPEKYLYENALEIMVLYEHDHKLFVEKMRALLNNYIVKKSVEKFCLTHEKSSYNTDKLLFKVLDSALEISDKNGLQYTKELVYALKKIVLIWAIGLGISLPVRGDKIQRILQTLYDPETCTPKALLDFLEIYIRPEDFLKDVLLNASAINYEPNYSKEDCEKLKASDGALFNLYSINPSLCELPRTYLDFISKYYKAKCGLCNQVPTDGENAICLLCGEVICLRKCEGNTQGFEEGNLSRHRREKHVGNGLFLEISSLMVVMIFGDRTLCDSGLNMYSDNIGQNVKTVVANPFDRQLDLLDFRRFYLNKEVYCYLEKLVKRNLIPIEQIKIGNSSNEAVFSSIEI